MARKIKNIDNALNRVIKYLKDDLKYEVVFDNKEVEFSECDPESKLITVNEKSFIEQLYTLLHESGHAMIFTLSDYNKSFYAIIEENDRPMKKRTKMYHYQVLKEEMLAWEYGLHLASKLNIFIDFDEYDKHAAASYMSYVYRASQNHYQRAVKNITAETGLEIKFDNYAK